MSSHSPSLHGLVVVSGVIALRGRMCDTLFSFFCESLHGGGVQMLCVLFICFFNAIFRPN